MLARLARFSYRRRRLVVVAWIVALVGVTALASSFGGEHRANYLMPGSESAEVAALLDSRFPEQAGDAIHVVTHADRPLTDADLAARTGALFEEVAGLEHVAVIEPQAVSADGQTAITAVKLDDRTERLPVPAVETIVHTLTAASDADLTVEAGGVPVQLVEAGEAGSEAVGMTVALLILLVAFGSVVAAGLPIAIAVPGLGVGIGLVPVLNRMLEVPEWAVPLATMIGIGVGIDYALFIVTRFRNALAEGEEPESAVVTALTTSGRAVLFAGGTVVISIVGLGVMGLDYMWGFVGVTVTTVLGVLAAAITLLPAVLGFAGRSIDRWRIPFVGRNSERQGLWARWSRVVQRRPAVIGGIALAFLLALAAPAVGLRFGHPDGGTGPESLTSRRAYDLISDEFGAGANGPLVVAVDLAGSPDPSTIATVSTAVTDTPGVAAVLPPTVNPSGDAATLTVIPTTGPRDLETERLTHRLREVVPAAAGAEADRFSVGGTTAATIDESDYMGARIPLFIGTVITLSFVLLLAVFRSVLVALKAALMNLLAIGAAYGVITVAISGGWFGDAIGITENTPVPVWVPIMMFAMLFGLSMDYEVFLLSRIREEYDRTGDNAAAVAEGIARTGRVITAAAAIMVSVFSAFMLNDDVISKVAGLGLATAVLVDATVVRMVLVPATMELLGERNWWIPGWLDRVLPHLDVEGERAASRDLTDGRVPALDGGEPGAEPEPALA